MPESGCGLKRDRLSLPCFQKGCENVLGNVTVLAKDRASVLHVQGQLEERGYRVFDTDGLVAAACHVMNLLGISMPYPDIYSGKEAGGMSKRERIALVSAQQEFTGQIFSNISLVDNVKYPVFQEHFLRLFV